MPRYRVSPNRSDYFDEWDDDWKTFAPSLTVDTEWGVDTGLVDQYGNPIFKQPNPIGFQADLDE